MVIGATTVHYFSQLHSHKIEDGASKTRISRFSHLNLRGEATAIQTSLTRFRNTGVKGHFKRFKEQMVQHIRKALMSKVSKLPDSKTVTV